MRLTSTKTKTRSLNSAKTVLSNVLSSVKASSSKAAASPLLVVGGITLFGALIRLYHLGYKSLWFDEAVMYWIAKSGHIQAIISQNAARNSAPPIFAILLSLAQNLGDSETILRLLPWVGGVASIPAVYFLAKPFLSKTAAYIVTFLVAIVYSQVIFSQYLREYSLTFLMATITLALFYRMLQGYSRSNFLLLTLSMIASIFLQFGLAVLIASLNLIFVVKLFNGDNRRKLPVKGWIVSQFFVLGAVAAVYFLALKEQLVFGWGSSGYLSEAYWDGSGSLIASFAFANTLDLIDFAYSGIHFLIIVLMGGVAILKSGRNRTALMMFLFPTVLTLGLAYARLYPYIGSRQDIFLTPMIYILFGLGVDYFMKTSKERWVVLLFLLVLFITGINDTYRNITFRGNEHMRPVAQTLADQVMEGDYIYVYYGAKPAFSYYFREDKGTPVFGAAPQGNPDWYMQEIDDLLVAHDRLWMIFSHCLNNECEEIPQYVSKGRDVDLVSRFNQVFLYLVE